MTLAHQTAIAQPATGQAVDVSTETLLAIHAGMHRIRAFEERMREMFLAGRLPGFVHLYVGEQAVATGVCAALRRDHYIASTHRGHGHALAKGARMDQMAAEIMGKATGMCGDKGGSMLVGFSVGMLR